MEAIKTKQDSSFKNKVIYLLIVVMACSSIYSMYKVNDLIDKYTTLAYFISPDMTYIGKVERGYAGVSEVEIRAMSRLFYSSMFSFSADTYKENLRFAKNNLVDVQTADYIESRFIEADIYNQLLRTNAKMSTLVDSISRPDLRREPIKITAYCKQYLTSGDEKSEQRFINTYEVYFNNIARTDDNPFGLQIRNWKNVRIED